MKIHCFSCGHDTETEEVKQPTEKPILRCAKCRSLNFRKWEEPKEIPLPRSISAVIHPKTGDPL